MATVVNIFSHTLGRKLIMSLTGLFLILFLMGHLMGNLLLFVDDGGMSFNEYGKFMTTNPGIKVLSYTTYISILLHVIYSIVLTLHNRKSRPVPYAYNKPAKNSVWSSRNMGILGTLVLVFIVIHMQSFWFKYHYGSVPEVADHPGLKDLYFIVSKAFEQGWYVALYVLSMVAIGFHLSHGFQSAFQTLGINHKAYSPVIKNIGLGFSILVPAMFASIPIYMYVNHLMNT